MSGCKSTVVGWYSVREMGMVWCQGNGNGMVAGQWGWYGDGGFMKAGASSRCLFTSLLI